MKKKTSVSIDNTVLAIIKREATKQDRSVSYILEKFIEEKARSIVEEQPTGPRAPSRSSRVKYTLEKAAKAFTKTKKRQAKRKSAA